MWSSERPIAWPVPSIRSTWNDHEFVDSYAHGRQLESAASFDCAASKSFWAVCFNPTEAGSRADGAGEKSSSQLIRIHAAGAELRTTTQMTFWLAPGEKSSGKTALNSQLLSDHLITKRVHIGHQQLANVIEYDVIFTVPKGERHHYAQFEALTSYMPAEFRRFFKFLPANGELVELTTVLASRSTRFRECRWHTCDERVLARSTFAR